MDATSSAAARSGICPPERWAAILGRGGPARRVHGLEALPRRRKRPLNVHGLNNKISLFVDARAAASNVKLNNIAVQDDLDDNTYEYVRRYLALTSFTGGFCRFPTTRGT